MAAALATHHGFVSAQHLHAQLRLGGQRIGLNTVYRTLYELAEAGDVDRVHDAHTGWLFRNRTARGHDHYLRCRDCGTATATATATAILESTAKRCFGVVCRLCQRIEASDAPWPRATAACRRRLDSIGCRLPGSCTHKPLLYAASRRDAPKAGERLVFADAP